MGRATKYPHHLARFVAARLPCEEASRPTESVLTSLLETLYFVSLKTDEGRPCRFTVNYLDPRTEDERPRDSGTDRWTCIRFPKPLPFDVRTLAKLAEAVEPAVSSLAVSSNERGRLFVWGLIDQELRYADYTVLDSAIIPERPGLFQATINGVGNISVYNNYSLICSLEQNSLVDQYHDVIWSGPIHEMLKADLWSTFERFSNAKPLGVATNARDAESELMTRWLNAVCRILLNIQEYRHGGGLLMAPGPSPKNANVKYRVHYDRLPKALVAFAAHQVARRKLQGEIADYCEDQKQSELPCDLHEDFVAYRKRLEAYRNEALGCIRFIASLSKVDGFVALDKSLVVHGFGVELRADSKLNEVRVAGDSHAKSRLARIAHLQEFGTRHRAMMRYCFEIPGTLGFVVSQDGDIRAMTRIGDKLMLWENINVRLAFKAQNGFGRRHAASLATNLLLNDVA